MSTQRYSVTPHPIETLLTWVKSGEIAIPEIQRPFVWEATKKPAGLAVPGLSGRLPHCVAQSDREAEGRHAVGWQAHPDRRPAARNGADGGAAWPGRSDQGLRDGQDSHRLPVRTAAPARNLSRPEPAVKQRFEPRSALWRLSMSNGCG